MKTMLLKLAAIGFGVTLALCIFAGFVYWYSNRPKPEKLWDQNALTDDGPPSFSLNDDAKHVEFRYSLTNSTAQDFEAEPNFEYRLLLIEPDGTLSQQIPLGEDLFMVVTPVFIPAHQKGSLALRLGYSVKRDKDVSDEEFHEQLRSKLKESFKGATGFALFDVNRHIRINLPLVASQKPKK